MGGWTKVDKGPTTEELFKERVNENERYDYKMAMTNQQLEEKAEDDLDFDEDEFMQEYRNTRMA